MLLTIKEVSAWLNIKHSTLYLWVAQRKIPCQRIHSRIRFEKNAIERWLASFSQSSGPSLPTLGTATKSDLDALIESAKRGVYTRRHGETRPKSGLIGKEEADGAV